MTGTARTASRAPSVPSHAARRNLPVQMRVGMAPPSPGGSATTGLRPGPPVVSDSSATGYGRASSTVHPSPHDLGRLTTAENENQGRTCSDRTRPMHGAAGNQRSPRAQWRAIRPGPGECAWYTGREYVLGLHAGASRGVSRVPLSHLHAEAEVAG